MPREPATASPPLVYPESDGKPMAETDLHGEEMRALIDVLKDRYRDEADVYVAGNNFLYYEEGNPSAQISPDVYVVHGVSNRKRRTYKLWMEKRPPSFVIEVSSRKTWVEDVGSKKAVYARIGVEEYFLFDPEGDYLDPTLRGYRLARGEYQRIRPGSGGTVRSRELGITFRTVGEELQYFDTQSGARILRLPERLRNEADARKRAEEAKKQAEHRVAELERQVAELRRKAPRRGRARR